MIHEPLRLTRRELQTALRIAADWSRADIAAGFGVSESAIKRHRAGLLCKFGVRSMPAAIARMCELGLLSTATVSSLRGEPMIHEPFRLTRREMQTALRIAADWSRAEIATDFGVSDSAIKRHREALLRKMGVSSMPAAIARMYELGLLNGTLVGSLRREAQAERTSLLLAA